MKLVDICCLHAVKPKSACVKGNVIDVVKYLDIFFIFFRWFFFGYPQQRIMFKDGFNLIQSTNASCWTAAGSSSKVIPLCTSFRQEFSMTLLFISHPLFLSSRWIRSNPNTSASCWTAARSSSKAIPVWASFLKECSMTLSLIKHPLFLSSRWIRSNPKHKRLMLDRSRIKLKSDPRLSIIPSGMFLQPHLLVYSETSSHAQGREERKSRPRREPKRNERERKKNRWVFSRDCAMYHWTSNLIVFCFKRLPISSSTLDYPNCFKTLVSRSISLIIAQNHFDNCSRTSL